MVHYSVFNVTRFVFNFLLLGLLKILANAAFLLVGTILPQFNSYKLFLKFLAKFVSQIVVTVIS